jgi:hypothetical protein
MNERIKELMKQAGTDTSGKWMGAEHAEKFAELIVRECAGVSENHKGMNDKYFIADAIKKHFGVEE